MADAEIVIGVISDTHGLLRPEALAVLAGSQLIIHAGDVGDAAILERLRQIAPVHAVRGNVDVEPWARELPETAVVEAGGVSLYVLHKIADLDLKPQAAGFAARASCISIPAARGRAAFDCRCHWDGCGCATDNSNLN